MAIIPSLLSVAENDVFKLLQMLCGDPLSASSASISVAVKAKGFFSGWSQKRSEQRICQGDSDEAAGRILAGMLRVEGSAVPQHAKKHLLLILEAFGEAWARAIQCLPGVPALRERDEVGRFANLLTWRWQEAFSGPTHDASAQLEGLVRQTGEDPLRSPYYHALWETLIDKSFEPPLYKREHKLVFEQSFRLAYSTALASQAGDEIRRYFRSLAAERPYFMRSVLISDLAGWEARQVFGNAMKPDPDLPDLPLNVLYVEPRASIQGQLNHVPVLGLLCDLLTANSIVAVSAPMGLGKSLTARIMAATRAREWLASEQSSPEVTLPIFVRCADSLDAQNVQNLSSVVQRAQHFHSRQLGFDLALDDPALVPPGAGQKVLYVFDGLDEVVLTESQIRDFFLHLDQKRSSDARFLVLSRPQTLEVLRKGELRRLKIPIVELKPFSTAGEECQAADWLKRWNQQVRQPAGRSPILWPEVEERKLDDLAATPILLFMIAETWDELSAQQVNHATLYEQFFQQLARGKHQRDLGADHKHIRDASQHLLQRLIERRMLPSNASEPAAMLWLMGRIAWKHFCLEQRQEDLHRHHVVQFLRDELKLKAASEMTYQTVADGLMLAMQADRLSEDPAILFGHKSFREFLVARYWQGQLRMLLDASSHEELLLWPPLLEGRLLASEDRSIEFLCDLVSLEPGQGSPGDSSVFLRRVVDWARRQFLDVSQSFPAIETLDDTAIQKYPSSLRHDRRAVLREAALAIGSMLAKRAGLPGLEAEDPYTLRSLLAWFWLSGNEPQIRAPRLVHPNAILQGAYLGGGDFRDADLQWANLGKANLERSNLSGCNLAGAFLDEACLFMASLRGATLIQASMGHSDLQHANLENANLHGALLGSVNFENAKLQGAQAQSAMLYRARLDGANIKTASLQDASLEDASLRRAHLQRANLKRAKMNRANLQGAYLLEANLEDVSLCEADLKGARLQRVRLNRANLTGANLVGANLIGAKLVRAKLVGAKLMGANFSRADLSGADLSGADLSGADLSGADLDGTKLDGAILTGTCLDGVDLASLQRGNAKGASLQAYSQAQQSPVVS